MNILTGKVDLFLALQREKRREPIELGVDIDHTSAINLIDCDRRWSTRDSSFSQGRDSFHDHHGRKWSK